MVRAYFFFDFFLAFAAFFDDLAFFATVADFFLPNAEAQLLLYFLVGPLRKIVMSVSLFFRIGEATSRRPAINLIVAVGRLPVNIG